MPEKGSQNKPFKMKKIGLKRKNFSTDFKRRIQNKILSGEYTGTDLCDLYGISRTTIYRWISEINEKSINLDVMNGKEQNIKSEESAESLKLRISKLEDSLKFEKLKSDAYHRMIKAAESNFKILIEKKSGPK